MTTHSEPLRSVKLPHSNVVISFTEEFDRHKLGELTRRLVVDDQVSARMRANPTEELSKLGIVIADADRKRVSGSDLDMLKAMGHRAQPGDPESPQIFALIVLVVTIIAE
jgi:hypothetical protein